MNHPCEQVVFHSQDASRDHLEDHRARGYSRTSRIITAVLARMYVGDGGHEEEQNEPSQKSLEDLEILHDELIQFDEQCEYSPREAVQPQ